MYLLVSLLALGLIVGLTMLITRVFRRRMGPESPWPPYIGAGIMALVFTWQEMIGYVQYQFACRDAGVRVMGSVTLPREFFNADGTPKFVTPEGILMSDTVVASPRGQLQIRDYVEDRFSTPVRGFIREYRTCVLEVKTGKALACAHDYEIAGGWLKSLLNVSFIKRPACGEVFDLGAIGGAIFRPE